LFITINVTCQTDVVKSQALVAKR